VQQGQDLPFAAVGKIRGMEQGESGGRQKPPLLSAARGGFDKRRGIPLRKMKTIPADFQPAFQQVQLRALPGPIDAFDNDQSARVLSGRLKLKGGFLGDLHRIVGRLFNG
jgi:hypothetical protein